ncbi:hypothetical protein P3T73_03860 [Kiritimatiellota bacterium B12222]|nr:hypothetical protein P3T73_03860 [Kiritimatiellota bacterium B12222]
MKYPYTFIRLFVLTLLCWGLQRGFTQETVENSIYIPYQEFWKVFEQENRGVFLPYEEYRGLMEAAKKASEIPEPDKMEGVLITELSGELNAGDQVVKGKAQVMIEAFSEGWHTVPLQVGEWVISSAQLDGKAARLRKESSGYVLVFEQLKEAPFKHTLLVEFAVPYVKTTANAVERLAMGEKALRFALPEVAVNRWTLSVPDDQVDFNLSDTVAVTEMGATEDPGTIVELFIAGHRSFEVKWTPEVEGAKNMEPVMQVDVDQEFEIQPDRIRSLSTLQLSIDRAPVDRMSFTIADDKERVVTVSSPRLKSWASTSEEDGGQRVEVQFQEPIKGMELLEVESERYEVPELWIAPLIQVEKVARQQGSVVVALDRDLKSVNEKVDGMSRLDVSQLQVVAGKKGTATYGWEYRALPAGVQLTVEAVHPEIVVVTTTSVTIDPRSLTQQVQAQFTVERSGIFQLELSIPEGYEMMDPQSLSSKFKLERHEVGEVVEGRRTVRFDFAQRIDGEVTLTFGLRREDVKTALQTPTGKEVVLEVPVVRGAGKYLVRDSGKMVIGSPAFLALRVVEREGLREDPWNELAIPASMMTLGQAQLGFRYSGDPVQLKIAAKRKEPFTTVTQLLVVQAQTGLVKFHSDLYVQVQYSGIRNLRIDVPTELNDSLRITKEDIRKRELTDAPGLAEGMTAWLLEGPTEFTGRFVIPLEWEMPLSGLDVGVQKDVVIPALIPRGVDRSLGQIILRKAESMDVVVREVGPELTPIDPRHDLLENRQIPDAALAFEYQRAWSLTATLVRYEPVSVKATSIDRGWVRQVITRGGEVSVQALYQIRSVRQRLELRLPEDAVFDSQPLELNGRSVAMERGGDGQVYIPLTGFKADEAVLLELRYSLPKGGEALRLPHFPEDPATQKIFLSVYVPESQVYLGHRGGWNPEVVWVVSDGFRMMPRANQSADMLWSWVRDGVSVTSSPLDRLPTDGQHLLFSTLRPDTSGVALKVCVFSIRWFYVMVIGCGLVLGLLLIRASQRTRIVVTMSLVAGLILVGVFLPSFAHALVNDATAAAALLVVVLWFVYDLVVRLPRVQQKRLSTAQPEVNSNHSPVERQDNEQDAPCETKNDEEESDHDA